MYFKFIIELSEFNLISMRPVISTIIPFLDDLEKSFDSPVFDKLGTIMLFGILLLLAIPLYFILSVLKRLGRWWRFIHLKLGIALQWNNPLKYLIESYISLMLVCVAKLKLGFEWNPLDWIVNLVIIVNLVSYSLLTAYLTFYLRQNFNRFRQKAF